LVVVERFCPIVRDRPVLGPESEQRLPLTTGRPGAAQVRCAAAPGIRTCADLSVITSPLARA
jgi:hypothetical protein